MAKDYVIKDSNGKDRVYKNVSYVSLTDVNGNETIFSETKEDFSRTYGRYTVKVIDYDGTVIKLEKLNSGDVFTLPEIPAHEKLEFVEWTSSMGIVSDSITVLDRDIIIAPLYTTRSGLIELDVEVNKTTGLTIELLFSASGTINWGDGDSSYSQSSLISHSYKNYGEYTITFEIENENNSITVSRGKHGTTVNDYFITEARFPSSYKYITMSMTSNYYIYYRALKRVSIPNETITYNNDYDCAVETLIIPPSATSVMLQTNSCVKNLVISSQNTKFSYVASDYNRATELIYPENYSQTRNVPSGDFRLVSYKYSTPITIQYLSKSKYRCIYDFTSCTVIPSLTSSSIFSSSNSVYYIIVVPDSLYDEWVATTNWSAYAKYIYKSSEIFG